MTWTMTVRRFSNLPVVLLLLIGGVGAQAGDRSFYPAAKARPADPEPDTRVVFVLGWSAAHDFGCHHPCVAVDTASKAAGPSPAREGPVVFGPIVRQDACRPKTLSIDPDSGDVSVRCGSLLDRHRPTASNTHTNQ